MHRKSLHYSFLNGKVVKKSLPSFRGPTDPAPVLKRLLLPQGELAQFYDSDEPIRYLAYIELREGGVRGNHYHEVKEEVIYVIQGELVLAVEDIDSRTRDSVPLTAGDLVSIPKRVAHALRTEKAGHAIELSTSRFRASDTYRHAVL